MKVLKNRLNIQFVAVVVAGSMTLMACGRAEMKSLRKTTAAGTKEFVTKNEDSVPGKTQRELNDDAVLRQLELDASAGGVNAHGSLGKVASTAEVQAAQRLASRIKDLSLKSADGKKTILLQMSSSDTIFQDNFNSEKQAIALERVETAKEEQYQGETETLILNLTKHDQNGKYILHIQEKKGAFVSAIIRDNSTILWKSDASKATDLKSITDILLSSTIDMQIVQLYIATGTANLRLPLESQANKVTLVGSSIANSIKFDIIGFPSYTASSTENTTETRMRIGKTASSNVEAYESLKNTFASQNASGSIAIETFVEKENDDHTKIIAGNPENIRAVDADLIRLVLKNDKNKSDKTDALILNVKIVQAPQKLEIEAQQAQATISEQTTQNRNSTKTADVDQREKQEVNAEPSDEPQANASSEKDETVANQNSNPTESESLWSAIGLENPLAWLSDITTSEQGTVKQGEAQFEDNEMNQILPPNGDGASIVAAEPKIVESASEEAVATSIKTEENNFFSNIKNSFLRLKNVKEYATEALDFFTLYSK